MSFIDKPKNYGVIALVLGLLMLVISVYHAIDSNASGISFASVIAGLFVLIFGFLLYSEQVKNSYDIVRLFMVLVGIAMFLAMGFDGFYFVVGIIFAVIGILLYLNVKSDILWWIGIIVGLIFIIVSIVEIVQGGFDIGNVQTILLWILVVFFEYNMLTSGVRSKF